MTPAAARRVRVLVVDDSALMRQVMTAILSRDPQIEVVGTAADPYAAWEKIQRLAPDVLTLDVEMPRMDGLTFLEKLMRVRPLPVVMVSSLTGRNCATTLRALELGALDFVTKPSVDLVRGAERLASEIAAKVKTAHTARMRARMTPRERTAEVRPPRPVPAGTARGLIAVGASTGGTEALRELLSGLPAATPGIVIVQHMPERFTRAFAERLDRLVEIRVREACDGDRVLPGQALLAPGNFHMELAGFPGEYRVRVYTDEPINRHRPSVDVLFHSCARVAGRHAVGVILTGMGGDGAHGLLAMRTAGARTVAQDEATCVVFGMPREAIELGAAELVEPLPRIPAAVLRLSSS
jgi:two-component system, chemotaxis family, protein-glutamate methylesterase/glutaminase